MGEPHWRPKFLYHGSQRQVTVLHPQPGDDAGCDPLLCELAVYATHEINIAKAFALTFCPVERGEISWTLNLRGGVPEIHLRNGLLDINRPGYLYRLDPSGFSPVDEFQWICKSTVRPIECELVDPRPFASWVVMAKT